MVGAGVGPRKPDIYLPAQGVPPRFRVELAFGSGEAVSRAIVYLHGGGTPLQVPLGKLHLCCPPPDMDVNVRQKRVKSSGYVRALVS